MITPVMAMGRHSDLVKRRDVVVNDLRIQEYLPYLNVIPIRLRKVAN